MRRRSFFGGLAAGLAGLVTGRAKADDSAPLFIPERDGNGEAVCRVYRQDAAGVWRQTPIADLRAGDRVICVGVTGDRLWKCEWAEIDGLSPPAGGDAGGYVSTTYSDILNGVASSAALPAR